VGPFPYEQLVRENAERTRSDPEFEIEDTAAFDGGCFDIEVRIAKASPADICWELTATNTTDQERVLHVLPTLWFRKTWGWRGEPAGSEPAMPSVRPHPGRPDALLVQHPDLGDLALAYRPDALGAPVEALFCDNETNDAARHGRPSAAPFPKDAINDHVVGGLDTVNPARTGTKAALWHRLTIPAGGTASIRVRLGPSGADLDLGDGFDDVIAARRTEADHFHSQLLPAGTSVDDAAIARQAIAGLVWSRCFYRLDVSRWIDGDPGQPPPPDGRGAIRNGAWRHLDARDVISMPDAWEYPWFAAWDLAFHCVALAAADPAFAKQQLLLLTREWFAHPAGALPAYEWDFSDVNPPVQAWAAREIFVASGGQDYDFLKRMFHKLLLNFTWWVNRQDPGYDNVFAGGFLGMDNVGPFDRSHPAPLGGVLEQADGTAWMALYCLDMLEIALLLAVHDPVYQDVAVKFSEHFSLIADALDGLWD
jgi:hypothetical protein